MDRFDGRNLGQSPHIVVLGSCKVGNFVVTVPLLRALRKKYPQSRIDFWGSELTRDFEEGFIRTKCSKELGLIDWRISWDKSDENAFMNLAKAAETRGKPDLLINCDGFNPVTKVIGALIRPKWIVGGCLSNNMRDEIKIGEIDNQKILEEQEWDSIDFMKKYSNILNSQYIGELICRMSFLEPSQGELENIDLPCEKSIIEVPDIIIHCTTTRSAKQWMVKGWLGVMEWCDHHNLKVGIVGASPKLQKQNYNSGNIEDKLLEEYGSDSGKCRNNLIDLRGKTSLIELAGICKDAKAVISVDAGPLHIAAAVGVPVLAIVGNDKDGIGASPIRLWLPRSNNVSRTTTKITCNKCSENKFKNDDCIAETHECMENIEKDQVIDWLETIINGRDA